MQLATNYASTKSEEANRLLRYYVAEKRSTIPFRKLRFIKAFAERDLLKEPAARRLVRKSFLAPILRWSITIVSAIILTSLYLFLTAEIRWPFEVIGRHWPPGEYGPITPQMLTKDRVATGMAAQGEYFRIWDAKTGEGSKIFRIGNAEFASSSPSGRFVLFSYESGEPSLLIDLSSMDQRQLPPGSAVEFAYSEDWLPVSHFGPFGVNAVAPQPIAVDIYSLNEHRVIKTVGDFARNRSDGVITPLIAENRLLMFAAEGRRDVIRLYDITSGNRIATLRIASRKRYSKWIRCLN